MKLKAIIAASIALFACAATAQVKPGIEVLCDNNFESLRGKRVGLITNPTGIDNNPRSQLSTYSPKLPGRTCSPFLSRTRSARRRVRRRHCKPYGRRSHRGTPFTPYTARRANPPRNAEKRGCSFIRHSGQRLPLIHIHIHNGSGYGSLRRGRQGVYGSRPPQPHQRQQNRGQPHRADCISFVSQFPIPYLYGLTPGELANYLNEEGLIGKGKKVKLSVIPMEGYTRDMDFRATGMPWVLPSPHMPTRSR